MKTRPDALVSAENDSGRAKHENETDAHGTVENESGHTKHENVTRRPRYRRKRVRESETLKRDPTPSVPPKMSPGAQNIKTGPDALATAENESGRAKHENGTRRPPYRRKRVRARKA
jgi:hypothetical protein